MNPTNPNPHDLLKRYLKVLLLQLAAKSDNPGLDLHLMVQEAIAELHDEVKDALSLKPHLKLVVGGPGPGDLEQ